MIPTVDERIASVIRALSDVILPHLPPEASLAQEQAQLAIGHLQILRAQIDQVPDFEREELVDYCALAKALRDAISGRAATTAALAGIDTALANSRGLGVREKRKAVNGAVERLIDAVSDDGDADARARLTGLILEHEKARSLKDRKWFAPFGFDTLAGDA